MRANLKISFLAVSMLILSIALVPESIHMVRASPPYTWNGPTAVEQYPGSGNLNLLPAVLQARNGTLWMAWQSNRFNGSGAPKFDIFYKTSSSAGVWTDPTNLTNVNLSSNGNNASPALAQLANDSIIVFWSALIGNSYKIVYEKYYVDRFGNQFWTNTVQLTSTSLNDTIPSATVARDGTLWLFWSRQSAICTPTCTFNYQIYYKTVQNGAWSPDTRLTTNNNVLYENPSAMTGKDGVLRVVWEEHPTVSAMTQLFYNSYNGITWVTELPVVTSSSPDAHPSIMQDRNGTIWLFWQRYQGPANQEVWVIWDQYSINGSTWSSAAQITSNAYPIVNSQPSAVQSIADKSIWVFMSSNLPSGGANYDIWALNSSPVSPVHAMALSSVATVSCVQPCKKYPTPLKYAPISQYANPVVSIAVTISNLGDFVEPFSLTLTASNTTSTGLGTVTGNAAIGSTTLVYSWNTTGYKPGRYTLSATVVLLASTETLGNTGDESLSVKSGVWIMPLGDIDQDGSVNLIDVSVVFYDYGTSYTCGCSRWSPYADVNSNGVIDIVDASVAARNYGITT